MKRIIVEFQIKGRRKAWPQFRHLLLDILPQLIFIGEFLIIPKMVIELSLCVIDELPCNSA
jgi:hypothetical protein